MNENKLENILSKFLFHEPFFASIIRSMQKIQTYSIPTAGVTIKDSTLFLYWNPDFLDSLTTKECFGLLKHECYHLIFKHILKRKHDPHLLWNIATDLAINSIIPLRELPKGGFVPGQLIQMPEAMDQKELEKRQKISNFIASLPTNKSSEWYMNSLLNNEDISEAVQEAFEGSESGDGEGCGFDVHMNSEIEDGEEAIAQAKIEETIRKAVENADRSNAWGNTPHDIREKIRSSVSKEINWKDILRNFCGNKQRSNKNRSFRKINRKYPYIHPGKKISHTSKIAIYIDQSGSVSNAEIALLFDNLNELAKRTQFTVFHFDATVDEKSRFEWTKRKKVTKPYRTRSGGTNFNSVEMFHRKVQKDFDGYIILSDGEAFKPAVCKSKRCWVILPGRSLAFVPDKRDTVVNMKF